MVRALPPYRARPAPLRSRPTNRGSRRFGTAPSPPLSFGHGLTGRGLLRGYRGRLVLWLHRSPAGAWAPMPALPGGRHRHGALGRRCRPCRGRHRLQCLHQPGFVRGELLKTRAQGGQSPPGCPRGDWRTGPRTGSGDSAGWAFPAWRPRHAPEQGEVIAGCYFPNRVRHRCLERGPSLRGAARTHRTRRRRELHLRRSPSRSRPVRQTVSGSCSPVVRCAGDGRRSSNVSGPEARVG